MNNMKHKILLTLALLITAVTGAWAQGEFSSDPYTSTTEFNSVSVTSSMTLNINEGVIVTVNSGLTIEDGVTLTLTGGGRLSVYGKSGAWGRDAFYEEGNRIVEATAGGDGNPAIILNGNAKIVIDNGEIYAEGGRGGFGGTDETAGINQPDGAAGNAFSRFPTIDGATLYYKSSYEWFKYTSGDQTLYNVMKAVPPTFEVTLNDTKTIASFEMPTYDVDVDYELVRDMSVQMQAQVGDDPAKQPRYRVQWNDEKQTFEPAEMDMMQVLALFSVNDLIEKQTLAPKNYFVSIYAVDAEGNPTGKAMDFTDFTFAPGRYCVTATGGLGGPYDGTTAPSNIFELYQGYQVVIPAGEYVTYYRNKALCVDEAEKENFKLYTVSSVSGDKATLSNAFDAAPSNTPFLVYNNTNESKTVLLIPCNEPDLALTVADQFQGTMEEKMFTDADMAAADYYVCNGKQFVKVRGAGTLGANKAYLKFVTDQQQSAPQYINIVMGGDLGEGTTGINNVNDNLNDNEATWYDLNGRKLNGKPAQKGIYIKNGKKVVVH